MHQIHHPHSDLLSKAAVTTHAIHSYPYLFPRLLLSHCTKSPGPSCPLLHWQFSGMIFSAPHQCPIAPHPPQFPCLVSRPQICLALRESRNLFTASCPSLWLPRKLENLLGSLVCFLATTRLKVPPPPESHVVHTQRVSPKGGEMQQK